jgi:hypothetical protein
MPEIKYSSNQYTACILQTITENYPHQDYLRAAHNPMPVIIHIINQIAEENDKSSKK